MSSVVIKESFAETMRSIKELTESEFVRLFGKQKIVIFKKYSTDKVIIDGIKQISSKFKNKPLIALRENIIKAIYNMSFPLAFAEFELSDEEQKEIRSLGYDSSEMFLSNKGFQ